MKTRQGFVSNSSSSSFIAVMLKRSSPANQKIISQVIDATEDDWWESLQVVGYSRYALSKDGVLLLFGDDEPQVGIDIDKELRNGNSIYDCKEQLASLIKQEYNLVVSSDEIIFDYGEMGNG